MKTNKQTAFEKEIKDQVEDVRGSIMKKLNIMLDKELHKIVAGFTKGLLGNWTTESKCFMVSYPLQGYLSFLGIECELVKGEVNTPKAWWGHFWVKLKDGRIIDPTIEQFNYPEDKPFKGVYIGELPSWYTELPTAQECDATKGEQSTES